ncbi:MAG: 16S rRNA (cytidine(1402)-2'-O)-methyltransferase [Patescibacteria group bacterium]
MHMKIYSIASPIGNLEDITFRAISILKTANFILCEDTRTTSKLLRHYGILTPTLSYHQHSKTAVIDKIIHMVQSGSVLALLTDAGTPGVSDPGNELIATLISHCGPGLEIIPIPGASAVSTLASVAGIPMNSFLFMGFPPHKKKRKSFFEKMARSEEPVVLFESPHRIIKTLLSIEAVLPTSYTIVGRELTKIHETIYRGIISDVRKKLEQEGPRGEFTVIVHQQQPGCAAHRHCTPLL